MYRVNEKSTAIIELTFYDEDGFLDIPTSASYRLDDKATGTAIIGTTSIPVVASTYRLVIANTYITIIDSTNEVETKILTLTWVDNTYTGQAVYEFEVVNLAKVS